MTNKEMQQMINKTANAAKKSYLKSFENQKEADPIVNINYGLPYVGINCADGSEYFFQGEEASNLLEEAIAASNKFNTTVENTLIWMSQGW